MKALLVIPLLCGCAMSRDIATIPHADGNGYTKVTYVAVGGGARPGTMLVFAQSYATNGTNVTIPPVVLNGANGAPALPSILGGAAGIAGQVGAAFAYGTGFESDKTTINNSVIPANPPPAPPVSPPPAPRPPWGPPPGRPRSPHNGGH